MKDNIKLREYVDLRFAQSQLAIDKAEKLMSDRLASMNEFRAQLKDQAASFLTRKEHDALTYKSDEDVKTLIKENETFKVKLDSLDKFINNNNSQLDRRLDSMNEFRLAMKDQQATYITRSEHEALMQKYDSEIKILNTAKDVSEGKASASSVIFAYILAGVGIILSSIGLFIKIGH